MPLRVGRTRTCVSENAEGGTHPSHPQGVLSERGTSWSSCCCCCWCSSSPVRDSPFTRCGLLLSSSPCFGLSALHSAAGKVQVVVGFIAGRCDQRQRTFGLPVTESGKERLITMK